MSDVEDAPAKPKRTRKMTDDMLDKLAKAREKAAEVRKQKKELREKEAAVKRMNEEKHAADVQQQYHAATRTQSEAPAPETVDTSALAPPVVLDGPVRAVAAEAPTPVQDTPEPAPPQPPVEAAPEPPIVEDAPPPVKMKVRRRKVTVKEPAKPKRRPRTPEPDIDQEEHEEPIVRSRERMPPNESERNYDALASRLAPPRGAPMLMRQPQQPLYRANSMRAPRGYNQQPPPPPQHQTMDDDALDAYHHEYEQRMHRVRSEVAYNSMFPTHALEQRLRGAGQGGSQYPRFRQY